MDVDVAGFHFRAAQHVATIQGAHLRGCLSQVKKKVVNNTEVSEPLSPKWQTFYRDDDADVPIVSFEFDDLKELASYEVKVRTRNTIGWSEYNQPFVFTTSHGQRPTCLQKCEKPVSIICRTGRPDRLENLTWPRNQQDGASACVVMC